MASKSFWEAVKDRRSVYALSKNVEVSDDKIVELVNDTILHAPSSFNSQSSRIVVLLKEEHDQFWDYVLEVLRPLVAAEAFAQTEGKITNFKKAYGTALFFEDNSVVKGLQESFAIFADKFPTWSQHTSAIHQYVLWTALESEGLGANLQHYNPVVDDKVKEHWKIPAEWELTGQLVFGARVAEPGPKQFKPLEGRVIVHGK
ncbi:nitroreductase family protein-like protein [Cladochytrium replicatum]|nr:nitroreductase family protein-like protein [Cladochytrium replicatum]